MLFRFEFRKLLQQTGLIIDGLWHVGWRAGSFYPVALSS